MKPAEIAGTGRHDDRFSVATVIMLQVPFVSWTP
jgi:hypothetical protein